MTGGNPSRHDQVHCCFKAWNLVRGGKLAKTTAAISPRSNEALPEVR